MHILKELPAMSGRTFGQIALTTFDMHIRVRPQHASHRLFFGVALFYDFACALQLVAARLQP